MNGVPSMKGVPRMSRITEPEKTKWTIIRIERGGGVAQESSEGPPALGPDWQKIPFSMTPSTGLS
jgi:hypothetical protein